MKAVLILAVFAALAALAGLAGCASTAEPRIEVREVRIPIAVSCAADPGPDPAYPDTDEALKAAPNILERARLMAAGRLLRIGRELELKAANAGCR